MPGEALAWQQRGTEKDILWHFLSLWLHNAQHLALPSAYHIWCIALWGALVNIWTSEHRWLNAWLLQVNRQHVFFFLDSDFHIAWEPKFITNKTETIIMYQSTPSSYRPKMNPVVWLVIHLALCLLIGGWLHHSFSVSEVVGWLTALFLGISAHQTPSAPSKLASCLWRWLITPNHHPWLILQFISETSATCSSVQQISLSFRQIISSLLILFEKMDKTLNFCQMWGHSHWQTFLRN